MSTFHWSCRKSSTKRDRRIITHRVDVTVHPLQRFHVKSVQNEKSALVNVVPKSLRSTFSKPSDPMDVILEGNDPLSLFQKQAASKDVTDDWDTSDGTAMNKYRSIEPWLTKKDSILARFSSNEVLTMTSCFSLQDKGSSVLRGRTDRLDDLDEGIVFEINDITPLEYFRRIDSFHKEVIRAWNEDQKVRALKIVIQCCKLLTDSFNYSFYPNKYVYVTDILDTFGNLVYKRLKERCEQLGKQELYGRNVRKFPENFTLEMVPEAAKETCRNWFYKIASIRELIPRLYIEAALLKSNSFITTGENSNILSRLSKMVNGVGDPLIAVYLRCYLCRIGLMYGADDYDFFLDNLDSFIAVYYKVFVNANNMRLTFEFQKYLESFVPPMEWVVEGVIINARDSDSIQLQLMSIFEKQPENTFLLYLILSACKYDFVVTHGHSFLRWMKDANYDDVPQYKLIIQFGRSYETYVKELKCKVQVLVLDEIWPIISGIKNSYHYMMVVDLWIPLSIANLPAKQINLILNNVIEHLSKETYNERFYSQLENAVRNIATGIENFMSFLIIENFLPFINLLHSDSIKVTICKTIMEAFVKRSHETFINDAVVLNNLMQITKILHDSINALTVEDEKRQISNLITHFVHRIDFGRDFEQQLEFYVEARGAFFNLDAVHVTLVQCVNKLSFETLKVVKGRHNSKTSSFVRACAAYCFITIPSIASSLSRLQLYMLSAQTSLANQCIGQADAYFKAILDTIPEFPRSIEGVTSERSGERVLNAYIKELISLLLIVPDNPRDDGSLCLIRSLTNILQHYSWGEPNSAKASLYIQILHILSFSFQDRYPYHFFNVDSNDSLYTSDLVFRDEVNNIGTIVLTQILKYLNILGMSGNLKKQANLGYELLFCVLLRADITNREMVKLAINLWNLSSKLNSADKGIAICVVEHCLQNAVPNSLYSEMFRKLLVKFE